MQDIFDFLTPVDLFSISGETTYTDGQFAKHIEIYTDQIPDMEGVELVIMGIGENRGKDLTAKESTAPDAIRKQLYQLHCWHEELKIADIGNIIRGAQINDSYAALQTVLAELISTGKKVLILGGSHDLTLAQCGAYKNLNQIIEASCIDALIDLKGDSILRDENFLLDMLTGEPNMVKNYNHIGFQSYFVHPRLLETMDKLRFDCYRVGVVRENIEEMEPVLRNSHLVSFDLAALKNNIVPTKCISPNGFTGEEACSLSQFAGSSSNLSSFGIYGYVPENDPQGIAAMQVAQMIWYFIDGIQKNKIEANLNETALFNEFHACFADIDSVFLQSKKTGRWWMQLPDKSFIACSHSDYVKASHNDIPERWLRSQERAV
jgi:arginase family enzyme